MAIDTYQCRIITGGKNHCDHSWNKTRDELDQCFKIYHPLKGEATIILDGDAFPVKAGHTYFISGYHIISQRCDSFMDICWLHFVPASLFLSRILMKSAPFFTWDNNDLYFLNEFDRCIQNLYGQPNDFKPHPVCLSHSFEEARLQSFMLYLLADVLKELNENQTDDPDDLCKLKPSVDFMDKHFRRNPPLEEIAGESALAPNYFHRIFKKNFGITPFNYMLRLRMDTAINLLTTTSLSIKEVAYKVGYENEFYFYKVFKKQFNYSPGKLKRMRPF